MLRRKLLVYLGVLVGLLLLVAVGAIWMLQGVLYDMDHTGRRDAVVAEDASQMSVIITEIELELREIELGREKHLDDLIDQVKLLQEHAESFGKTYSGPLPEGKGVFDRILETLPVFEHHVAMLATVQDPQLLAAHTAQAMGASVGLRKDIMAIGRMMHEHIAREQAEALAWFRWLVLALAIVFLLVINTSVMVLLRMANMILRPVDKLVEASRCLAREEFDYRVEVGQDDEFGELARAYNRLAEALQANEQRKLETFAQTAVMLNHELNNASSIIKLQLQMLEKQSSGGAAFERSLRQINASLARMTAVVEALKRVRRIVLTDYSADVKMLDLQRSVQEDSHAPIPLEEAGTVNS